MKTILIIGATSGIAEAFCFEAIHKGYNLILAGRNMTKLQILSSHLKIKTNINDIQCICFDVKKFDEHASFFEKVLAIEPNIFGCFIACGVMFDQFESKSNFNLCKEIVECNYLGLISLINIVSYYFEKNKTGFISCITSVAGDRGRPSNYIYGSSKSALNTYLEGLRCYLFKHNVLVQTVKPGPVNTLMTKGLKNLPFLTTPNKVAKDILKAIENKKTIVYSPNIWKWIMTIINNIPEFIYNRLNL